MERRVQSTTTPRFQGGPSYMSPLVYCFFCHRFFSNALRGICIISEAGARRILREDKLLAKSSEFGQQFPDEIDR
jgi:hypothetical protein